MIIPEKPLPNEPQPERSLSEPKVGLLKELPYHISDADRLVPPRHPSLSQSPSASSSSSLRLRSSSHTNLKVPQHAATSPAQLTIPQQHHQRSLSESRNPLSRPLDRNNTISDQPPPYVEADIIRTRSVRQAVVAAASDIHSVNAIHIHNSKQSVVGTYCIDPTLPVTHKSKVKAWKGFGGKAVTPNASLRSRNGDVSVNIATRGTTHDQTKAYVQAYSKRGDVQINLYSLQRGKHINLDASSKDGNVLLFIPRNFSGVIRLHGKKDGAKILPAIKNVAKILHSKNRETLLLIGDPGTMSENTTGQADDVSTDYCQITSERGNVVLGFTGEDEWEPEVGGFWKKIGNYLGQAIGLQTTGVTPLKN